MPVPFDALTLHYQPQFSADGLQVVSAEALLRVLKPKPRLMGPADVLTYFHAPEDAAALDWWVLQRAFRDALQWPDISIGINLTAERFHDPGFADAVFALANEIGVNPARIELEIVESAYIKDFETACVNMSALRAKGFRIAIDDFGTGYSSLTYLLKLPVDKLKIDKSFVDGLEYVQSAAIIHAVVAMARAMGLKITAEGVETEDQHRFLKLAGCHFMQGWLFAKAMDARALTTLLRRQAPPERAIA